MSNDIKNPGSALGEAVGKYMEIALNKHLTDLVAERACHLISKGPYNHKTGKNKKLLLRDQYGTDYNIDAVIANESLQPLIIIEYKYIRYKKHNRDKGSWVCTAHNAIRRHYTSIRSSFAILAGNWSGSSVTMMKSHGVNIFMIPFSVISQLLARHEINFDWGEKDRATALSAWNTYSQLTEEQKMAIGEEMIQTISGELESAINNILDDTLDRELEDIVIEIHTNLGEVKVFKFKTPEEAIEFLEDFGIEDIISIDDAISLFDGQVSFDENGPQMSLLFGDSDE